MSVFKRIVGVFVVAGLCVMWIGVSGIGAQERKGNVDSNHSNVGFEVPIFGGISLVKGKFGDFWTEIDLREVDGVLHLDKIVAVIQAKSVDTGIDQRDTHLRAPDFFNARKGDGFVAHGTFTMRGIAKGIDLPIEVVGRNVNPENGKVNLGFTATVVIDRTDYDVSYQHKSIPDFIGKDVRVVLNILTRSLEL